MTTEQALFYLVAAIAAVWAVVKVLLPRVIDTRLKSNLDEQEHRQRLEQEWAHYANLDNAGWASKASELLELHESFLREQVWEKLEAIEVVNIRFEYTQAQTRDEMAIISARLMRIEDALDRIIAGKREGKNDPTAE